MPLYKLIIENDVPYLKNLPIHLDNDRQSVIIEEHKHMYLIRIGDWYLSKKLELTEDIDEALMFSIEETPMGYKIIIDDLCLSRGIGGELLMEPCYDDNSHKSVVQRFEFVKANVRTNFHGEVSENSMEKMFRNTAVDNVLKKQLYNLYLETQQ